MRGQMRGQLRGQSYAYKLAETTPQMHKKGG